MSGVGVLIVFDQEQARRHPLVFLKQRNKWCHKIADVLMIWRSAPHMTIHWRPSRTHQRRGVLSHVLSLKFCAVLSRGLGHTLWTGKAACMRTYIWDLRMDMDFVWFCYFSTSEKVFLKMSRRPGSIPKVFRFCSMHRALQAVSCICSHGIFGYSGASCDVQRIEKLEKNDNIRKMKSASETWSVEIVRNCALDYTLQPAWLS